MFEFGIHSNRSNKCNVVKGKIRMDFSKPEKPTKHPAPRYFLVGLLAFAVDYGTLLVLYYLLSIPLSVATSLGFVSGLILSFFSNRHWVFGENGKHRNIAHQSIEYVILVIFNYSITVLGVRFLNNKGVHPYYGKLIVMSLIMCWNYTLFKKAIFAGGQSPPNLV